MNCDNPFGCFLSLYPSQSLLIIIGLVFLVIGAIVYSVKGTLKLDVWPFKDLTIPKISKSLGVFFAVFGCLATLVGLVWLLATNQGKSLNAASSTQLTGSVSLVSLKYASGGWNPHMVDLRAASTSGIPAGATFPLKFSEITVFAPPDLAGYQVWAEFLANDIEKIGETPVAILQTGLTSLEQAKATEAYRYQDKNTGKYLDDSWDVLKSWETIAIHLKYKSPSGQEGSTTWTIKLNQMEGAAWWNPPPDVNIISVVYSVNDGLRQVLDFRRNDKPAMNAKAGDWITIHEVWYKANTGINNQSMLLGGSVNNGQQELENQTSGKVVITEGIHRFENFSGMTWSVSADIKWLGLWLIRGDEIVLDNYVIEISSTEQSGLVSTQKSVVWPFKQLDYIDFEEPATITQWNSGWGDGELAIFETSNKLSFSGNSSMSVTVSSSNQQAYLVYNQPVKAKYIVGQIYWPQQAGMKVRWANLCLVETSKDICVSITPEQYAQWQVFVLDISSVSGKPISEISASKFYFNGEVLGASSAQPYTFYVDGIQIYPIATP